MAYSKEDQSEEAISKLTGADEKKLLTELESWMTVCKNHRLQFEKQWYMNLAFFFGKQWVQWLNVGMTSRLHVPDAPPWRVRLVSNKIKPIIRTELAKMTAERPQPFVVPASSDDEDLLAARAGEQIFEHHMRELKYFRELRRALFWTALTGNGFIKDWYNPLKIEQDIAGAVDIERVNPFQIYVPEVHEEDIEDQPYVIHAISKPKQWVLDNYGEAAKGIAANASSSSDILTQKFFSALNLTHTPKNMVTIQEAWIKPTKKYPDGCVVTWVDGKVLRKVDHWPYEHKEYPFTKFDHILSGKFYSDSVITDLIPLQKEYNRTRSQIIEAKNRMSKPQLIAARGSVDANKMTSEPGLVIEYTPGFNPPQPLPLQSLPAYVREELEITQRDMDDISAQHEVTKGRTPPGVSAATAIAYLQEEDNSKLSTTIASIEEGTEKIGRHILSHVGQFWEVERVIKVAGDMDGIVESVSYKNSSIRGNTDLRIESGSAMPRSRAAKQAFLMDLGDKGWIPPDRVLKYLEMAETGRLHEELHIDQRQAQRENVRMMNGDPEVTVNAWDNHEIHVTEHNNFRKRQRFETLPDEVKELFQMHVQMHEQLMKAQMGEMAPPGAPMPPGGPSPNGSPQGPPSGQQEQTSGIPGPQPGEGAP